MAKYELLIKNNGDGDGYSSAALGNDGNQSGGLTAGGATNIYKSFAKAWNGIATVRQAASWHVSVVERDMGNDNVANKISAIGSIASQAGTIIGSFAVGGPIAGILAMATVGISYAKQAEQFNYESRWEGYAMQQSQMRAGPSFNRSRQ